MSVETIVKKEEKSAVEEMVQFIRSLSEEEQREVSSLMRGVAFGVKLARSSESKKVKMAAGMQTAAGLPKRKDDNCEKNKRRY